MPRINFPWPVLILWGPIILVALISGIHLLNRWDQKRIARRDERRRAMECNYDYIRGMRR
jgi:hypothetical protein